MIETRTYNFLRVVQEGRMSHTWRSGKAYWFNPHRAREYQYWGGFSAPAMYGGSLWGVVDD